MNLKPAIALFLILILSTVYIYDDYFADNTDMITDYHQPISDDIKEETMQHLLASGRDPTMVCGTAQTSTPTQYSIIFDLNPRTADVDFINETENTPESVAECIKDAIKYTDWRNLPNVVRQVDFVIETNGSHRLRFVRRK